MTDISPYLLSPRRPSGRPAAMLLAWASLLAGSAAADLPGDEPPASGGFAASVRLVTIPLPITGKDDQTLKGTLQRALDQLTRSGGEGPKAPGAGRPILVLQFAPDPRAALPHGRGSEFERALALARFLAGDQMAAVKTIAFLPQTVKGHAILPIIACEEIVMAADAEIGEAAADEPPDRPIEPYLIAPYRDLAEARRTVPPALALGWIDRRVEVYSVESDQGTDLVLADELPEIEAGQTIIRQELLIPSGVLGLATGRLGRELGFVKFTASDRAAVARVLGVPASALDETEALGAEWNPVVIDVTGEITERTVRRVETLIGDEIDQRGVNWIGLRIDSGGGQLEPCLRLATTIASLNPAEVRTVAYVPGEATGGAGLVALACDQLVMQPNSHLGGGYTSDAPPRPGEAPANDEPAAAPVAAEPVAAEEDEKDKAAEERRKVRRADEAAPAQAAPDPEREQTDAAVRTLREALADKTRRPWSLLAAVIDPERRVFRYTHQATAEERLMSEDEAAALPDAAQWRAGPEVTNPGESLRIGAEAAEELGVAWRVVETFDELTQLYGFDAPPRVAKPNWALELVESLRSRQFAMLLLMVGFMGIYIELNMPGVGFGGFIAAVAFVLFFWSRFTAGTADWLEVMLFVTGMLCILLEILVLPGVGVFGFGGAVLVLASLVLASQTFIVPKTASQIEDLRNSLATVAGAFAAMIVAGVIMRRFLPHTPLFRRMQLAPAEGADRIDLDHRESVADYAHLVGKTGRATTNLLPSGRAEIDGELVDVIADGDVIDRGAEVEVVSARASRVMVRAIKS